MKIWKAAVCGLTLVVLAFVVWVSLRADEANAPGTDFAPDGPPPVPRLQAVQELGVPSFTNGVTVYYSTGHETRARQLSDLIADASRFYESQLKIKAAFSVAVLTKSDWERVEPAVPFGLPSVSAAPQVILLPATHDGIIVKDTLALRGKASPATLTKIEQSGFTFARGSEKFLDLIGLHELGHALTLAYGIRPPSRWSNEFLATYFAYAYLRQSRPHLAALFVAMTRDLQVRDAPKPRYTTLEDFDLLYSKVGSVNYGWYQSRFVERVEEVYDARQLSFLEDVRTAYPSDAREGEPPHAVLERLERICPGFVAWGAR